MPPITTNAFLALPLPLRTRLLRNALVDEAAHVLQLSTAALADTHSLRECGVDEGRAAEIAARVRQKLGIAIPPERLTSAQPLSAVIELTITELSRVEGTGITPSGRSAAPAITPSPMENRIASFTQSRLWFLEKLDPGTAANNIPSAVHITGPLDVSALERSLGEIVRRHESLRTSFPTVDGHPVPIVAPPFAFTLPIADLDRSESRLQMALEEAAQEASRPFDIARGPLIRARVWRIGPNEHLLGLTVHHLVADGWSFGVLTRELSALYRAFHASQQSPLAELPLQYGDFARWQHQHLAGEQLQRDLAYWRQHLAPMPPPLDLPTDRPRPRFRSAAGGLVRRILPRHVADQLRDIGKRQGATLFMTLLAGFNVLLHRYTGQSDIVVGTPIAGRTTETAELIGFFANTLALRTRVSRELTFRDVVGRVRQAALGAYEHQDVPFERIVDMLQPERDLSRTTVFEVMFVLQTDPMPDLRLDDVVLRRLPIDSGTSKYDLTLAMEECDAGLSASLEFNADLFERATADRMLGHLDVLLAAAVAEPDEWISRLPLLTPGERDILEQDRVTDLDPRAPSDACLHERFEAQVDQHPDATAVIAVDRSLTYAELEGAANRLAARIRELGAEPGTLVAVSMEKGWQQAVACVAVMKAGAAYLPVDPALPRVRRWYLAQNGQARIVITQPHLSAVLDWPEEVHPLTVDASLLDGLPARRPARVQEPGDLAYVIFTSGSTGVPKGVMIDHRAALNTIEDLNERFAVGPADRVLALSSLSFDLSVYDFFGTWAAGAAAVIPAPGTERDPSHWAELIERHQVTIWDSVPALMDMLVSYAAAGGRVRLETLRVAFLSGDWIPVGLPDRLRTLLPGIRVISMGGATEASIWSIIYPVERVDPAWRSIPYGRGLRNQQWFVLDALLEPCPIGVPGDLYIAGTGLAQGYWRDPAKSATSFIQHPRLGRRLYRTGDRGRLLADGNIEFLGREDLQVKIQGHRIELPEIERALGRHPSVGEMIVDVRKAPSGSRRLVAYIVPAPGHAFDPQALRHHVESRLPAYMVPSAFVRIDRLPLSDNGKVQPTELPDPDEPVKNDAARRVEAETASERVLLGIWSDLLGGIGVGCTDNFFAAGGHSLLAIHLTARIRDQFGVELPVRKVFEAPTVRTLAAAIDELVASTDGPVGALRETFTVQASPSDRFTPFPLADLPEAYWFGQGDGIELGNTRAHTYIEFEVEELDLDRLHDAVNALIGRHAMLRAIVLPTGEQMVLESVPAFDLVIHDLRGLGHTAETESLDRIRRDIRENPPNGEQWPLFHFSISRLDSHRWRLHLGVSLLIADAMSGQIFFRELAALYKQPAAALPECGISYRDCVLSARAYRDSDEYRRAEAYWRARLGSLPPPPDLPLARTPASLLRPEMSRRTATVDAETWSRIKVRAASAGISPNGVLSAAYAEVLATWSRSRHFTLNVLYVNRRPLHPDIDSVFGNFSSTILLEVDFDKQNDTFGGRASRLQGQLWDDLDHSAMTGVRVAAELNRARGEVGAAGMPVVFASTLAVGARTAEATNSHVDLHVPVPGAREVTGWLQTPQVWIDHNVFERHGALLFNWDVVEELFHPGVIDSMFGAYQRLLHLLAADESVWQAIDIPLVPAPQLAERAFVNRSAERVAPNGLLHASLSDWARRTPDALAVVSSRRSLTYADLQRRSTVLARRVRERQVSPDTLVAIVMHKGWEQVVAACAVLEAGAAYLPVDARLPRDRIHHLLAQGEVSVALTTNAAKTAIEWPSSIEVLCVDEAVSEHEPIVPLPPIQTPRQLAYVIFTSGSTGSPKGVMIEHLGALNTIVDINQRFGVRPGDRILALSSLGFDLSVYDIFGTIAAGATLVLPSDRSTPEPGEWIDLIETEHVTIWNSVPALASMLVDSCSTTPGPVLRSLRLVLLSGDWIPVQLPDRLRAHCPDAEIVSLGGATEASIWSIIRPIDRVSPTWKSIPYGRPMWNQTFHVLDSRLQPSPMWVAGQLYIGGVGLARGYWRDDQKTRASFIVHPQSGERLYRTGDLGRYLPDGEIEFLGRDDLQVKVQGFRIELGEIETVLAAHPSVMSCAVVARGSHNGRHLVAHVVASAKPLDVDQLRTFLGSRLPEYMVPRVFAVRDSLPLSSNGKVDRRILADEAADAPRRVVERVAPRNSTERRLGELWESTLGVPDIGVADEFFALGGDSLGAVRLIARIEREFGRRLPLSVLLRGGTVEKLSSLLGSRSVEAATPLLTIQPKGDRAPLVLVHPVGGHVFCYAPFAQQFGEAHPVYGLQAVGLDAHVSPLTTIEAMAAFYVDAIRALTARGPVVLGGWSLGGVIAFEMARQFQAAGHGVEPLLLIDSWAPGTFAGVVDEVSLIAAFCADLARSSGMPIDVSDSQLTSMAAEARLDYVLAAAHKSGALPRESGREDLRRLLAVFAANMRALAAYRGSATPVRALVVKAATQRPGGPADPALGWRGLCADVELYEMPGDHYSVFDRHHLPELSARVRTWMDRVRAESASA